MAFFDPEEIEAIPALFGSLSMLGNTSPEMTANAVTSAIHQLRPSNDAGAFSSFLDMSGEPSQEDIQLPPEPLATDLVSTIDPVENSYNFVKSADDQLSGIASSNQLIDPIMDDSINIQETMSESPAGAGKLGVPAPEGVIEKRNLIRKHRNKDSFTKKVMRNPDEAAELLANAELGQDIFGRDVDEIEDYFEKVYDAIVQQDARLAREAEAGGANELARQQLSRPGVQIQTTTTDPITGERTVAGGGTLEDLSGTGLEFLDLDIDPDAVKEFDTTEDYMAFNPAKETDDTDVKFRPVSDTSVEGKDVQAEGLPPVSATGGTAGLLEGDTTSALGSMINQMSQTGTLPQLSASDAVRLGFTPAQAYQQFRLDQMPGASITGMQMMGDALGYGFDPIYGRHFLQSLADTGQVARDPMTAGTAFTEHLRDTERPDLSALRTTYTGLSNYLTNLATRPVGEFDIWSAAPEFQNFAQMLGINPTKEKIIQASLGTLGIPAGFGKDVGENLRAIYDLMVTIHGEQGQAKFADWVETAYGNYPTENTFKGFVNEKSDEAKKVNTKVDKEKTQDKKEEIIKDEVEKNDTWTPSPSVTADDKKYSNVWEFNEETGEYEKKRYETVRTTTALPEQEDIGSMDPAVISKGVTPPGEKIGMPPIPDTALGREEERINELMQTAVKEESDARTKLKNERIANPETSADLEFNAQLMAEVQNAVTKKNKVSQEIGSIRSKPIQPMLPESSLQRADEIAMTAADWGAPEAGTLAAPAQVFPRGGLTAKITGGELPRDQFVQFYNSSGQLVETVSRMSERGQQAFPIRLEQSIYEDTDWRDKFRANPFDWLKRVANEEDVVTLDQGDYFNPAVWGDVPGVYRTNQFGQRFPIKGLESGRMGPNRPGLKINPITGEEEFIWDMPLSPYEDYNIQADQVTGPGDTGQSALDLLKNFTQFSWR